MLAIKNILIKPTKIRTKFCQRLGGKHLSNSSHKPPRFARFILGATNATNVALTNHGKPTSIPKWSTFRFEEWQAKLYVASNKPETGLDGYKCTVFPNLYPATPQKNTKVIYPLLKIFKWEFIYRSISLEDSYKHASSWFKPAGLTEHPETPRFLHLDPGYGWLQNPAPVSR